MPGSGTYYHFRHKGYSPTRTRADYFYRWACQGVPVAIFIQVGLAAHVAKLYSMFSSRMGTSMRWHADSAVVVAWLCRHGCDQEAHLYAFHLLS